MHARGLVHMKTHTCSHPDKYIEVFIMSRFFSSNFLCPLWIWIYSPPEHEYHALRCHQTSLAWWVLGSVQLSICRGLASGSSQPKQDWKFLLTEDRPHPPSAPPLFSPCSSPCCSSSFRSFSSSSPSFFFPPPSFFSTSRCLIIWKKVLGHYGILKTILSPVT